MKKLRKCVIIVKKDEPLNIMHKSLTTSIQQAMNTVKDLTHIDQTVPYITSVLEQPIALLTKNEFIETATIANADDCAELPPIKNLPEDLSENVLESIVNEFKEVTSDADEIRKLKSEELQRKLKLYNSIMEKKYDEEVIHSRRSRKRETGSGHSTPRMLTPGRKPQDVSYTAPCVMNVSVYGSIEQENDDLLEKQIEEKEKMLAKRLNLESLSIKSPEVATDPPKEDIIPTYKNHKMEEKQEIEPKSSPLPVKKTVNNKIKNESPRDLVPKVVKLPNTWNLENIELRLEMQANCFKNVKNLVSPDDNLEADWEII